MNKIESAYRKLSRQRQKFLLGVTMLSILIFLFPPLYGEGYDTI